MTDRQRLITEIADEIRIIQQGGRDNPDVRQLTPGLVVASIVLSTIDEKNMSTEEAKQLVPAVFNEPGVDQADLDLILRGVDHLVNLFVPSA